MSLSKESLPSWGYAVAGATGAVLANAAVYPLDMYVVGSPIASTESLTNQPHSVKTKLQVQVKRQPTDEKTEPLKFVPPQANLYPQSI